MAKLHGFLIFCTIASAIISAGFLLMMSTTKTPKWLDILSSIFLLAFAAFFVGLLQSILNAIPKETPQQNDLIAQYQTAILIIPFFTAALASNLLSHVILSNRQYDNTISLWQALQILGKCIIIVLLTISIFGLIFYVAYVKWGKGR
ncbi:hypothetical protein [Delftia tsuruhatensis]|jgi:hypothetical protein|uniref:hypothetical protein n=1 Tax=Delftia tsuruhatensis TaxID=180282 RepID=UPI0028971F9D|nr:hypothetical protein [Delftia tsuruhatensis]